MSETTVDNRAIFLGRNNKESRLQLEVPAGADRVIPKGTLLSQKSGDGTLYQEQLLNVNSQVVGILNADVTVAADAGVTTHVCEAAIDGHIDEKKIEEINSIDLDDISGTNTLSYRNQLEKQGFVPIFRENL